MGIALLSTLVTRREQFHSQRIGEGVSLYSAGTQETLVRSVATFVQQGYDAATASQQALETLQRLVRREAFVMAYNDAFLIIALIVAGSALFLAFCSRSEATATAGH